MTEANMTFYILFSVYVGLSGINTEQRARARAHTHTHTPTHTHTGYTPPMSTEEKEKTFLCVHKL